MACLLSPLHQVALADVGVTEWRSRMRTALACASVALADVGVTEWREVSVNTWYVVEVALADVGVTEWRGSEKQIKWAERIVALADVGVTEWREEQILDKFAELGLHSLMLVLLNGGGAMSPAAMFFSRCTR